MPNTRRFQFITLFVLVILFVVACRREEEVLPTAVPTAIPPTAISQPEAVPAAAVPTETAVAPQANPIDPAQIDWSPQIVYSSPAPGEEALLDGAVTIRFDQPMNQQSVETAFSAEQASSGRAVSGEFSWPRPDTLIFTPRTTLARQQTYNIRINNNAKSSNGIPLKEPVSLTLQTVGNLEVSQVIPAPGTTDVQPDTAVTVLFNRPVVPLVTTAQQADLPHPLTFNPPISGQGEWISTSIYRFTPEEPLAGGTSYEVTIDPSLTDVTGGQLERPYFWRFNTLQPKVVGVTPDDGSSGIIPTDPIRIEFNMAMDPATTEAAVSLVSANRTSVPLQSEWQRNNHILVITPTVRLDLDTTYQIRVSQNATAAGGTSSLAREFTASFKTVPFPAVLRTNPADGETADPWLRGISIEFASPMNFADFADRILIEPTPKNAQTFYRSFPSQYLDINFEYEPSTEYTVIIPGDAADPYGNTLGRDYRFSFTSPDGPAVASLNLPSLISQLSTSFETRVDVIHRNVTRVSVALYNLGLPLNLLGRPYEVTNYLPSANPIRTWQITPDTPRNEVDVTSLSLADGGSLPTGAYLLSLDAPELENDARYWQNQQNLLIIADTNLVVKEMFDNVYVWATDIRSGQPVNGRSLTLYNQQGVQLATAVTNQNGFAAIAYKSSRFLEGVIVVSNQPGEVGFGIGASQWNTGVEPYRLNIPYDTSKGQELFAYIYTDRPIYRPGDTIYFKGIVRQNHYGRYTLPEKQTLNVAIGYINYFGGEDFTETFAIDLSADGTFDGQYTLPANLSLGSYRIYLPNLEDIPERLFTVAEYRTPEFLVEVTPASTDLLRGTSSQVTVQASYFFGGAATDLDVSYTIYARPYRLPLDSGPYYSIGDDGGFFYEDMPFFPFDDNSFVTSGEGITDSSGRFTIPLPPDLLADFKEGSYRLQIEATVQTLGSTPVTSRTEMVYHAAETYVGVRPEKFITPINTAVNIDLLTLDWNSQPTGSQPVDVVIYQREWNYERVVDFAGYTTKWIPVDTEVAAVSVTTDADGEAKISFTPESGGTYVIVATVTDRNGRTQTSTASLWATDSSYFGWRTDPRQKSMTLTPDQDSYHPGDTARILVQSPFTGPVKAWLTIERGTLIEQRVITLETASDVLEIPIPPEFAPNVFVTVTAVKPITPDNPDNPYADIRLGVTELIVSPELLTLNVNLSPQSDQYGPGDTAVYDITVTDANDNPVSADVSLALVDLAVLTLKEDNAPPIEEAFYSRQPLRSVTGGTLFISGEGLDVELPLQIFGMGGGGGGLEAAADVGRIAQDDEDTVRRDFPDTAFWQAHIKTDGNGRAVIEIPLPDSLTTWRLSAKAVTPDTLVGQNAVDVIVSLPLLVRPVTPRFFTVDDEMQIGTYINNNTGSDIDAEVTLEAEGVTIQGDAVQQVTVPANGRSLVLWPVTVNDTDFANLTFRAVGGGYRDASKPTFGQGPDQLIPIYRYNTTDVTGTSGMLTEPGREVEAILLPTYLDTSTGTTDITLSASLAAALLDSVEVVNHEPREVNCTYAVIDELLPNAALALAAQELNAPALSGIQPELDAKITENVQELLSLVHNDGGWSWCPAPNSQSSGWLTAYALLALDKAEEAGYDVPQDVLNQAIGFLERQILNASRFSNSYEANQQAFYLYVLAEQGVLVTDDLDQLVDAQRTRLDPYAKAMAALAYVLNGDQGNNVQTLLADLNDSAVLTATGTHWEDESHDYRNLNSNVRGTAVVIWALAQVEPDNQLLPQAVRWLMSARELTRWRTFHETAFSVLALSKWMALTGELDANYEYALEVNLLPVQSGTFAQENLAKSVTLSVPLSSLLLDEVNFFSFVHEQGEGTLYYTMHLNATVPASEVTAVSRGITIERTYFDADCDPQAETCQPIDTIKAGKRVRVQLTIIAPNDLLYPVITDYIPAGTEAIDPGLATSAQVDDGVTRVEENYRFGYWGWWFFNRIEYRDDRVVFFSEFLPAGTYQYTYFLDTTLPGSYQVRPTIGQETFFPEVFGRADGMLFTITKE
ncbi:MAG: hypothetical protein Kow0080_32500 [Candidatus Promineifilaceae bacterium]